MVALARPLRMMGGGGGGAGGGVGVVGADRDPPHPDSTPVRHSAITPRFIRPRLAEKAAALIGTMHKKFASSAFRHRSRTARASLQWLTATDRQPTALPKTKALPVTSVQIANTPEKARNSVADKRSSVRREYSIRPCTPDP